MIDYIEVDNYEITAAGLTVYSSPFGFSVVCTERDTDNVSCSNTPFKLFIELEIKEEEVSLMGFSSHERRGLYRFLKTIPNIGRKSALMVINCGEVRDTLRAVVSEDYEYFYQVSGLGKVRIQTVIKKLNKNYKESLPNKSNISISDWVSIRDSLASNFDASIDKLDKLINNSQEKNASPEKIMNSVRENLIDEK